MAGLNKELWELNFRGLDNSHLHDHSIFTQNAENWDAYVDGAALNFTFKGNKTGNVQKNPTFPLPITTRTDVATAIPLDYYATDADRVTEMQIMGLANKPEDSLAKDQRDDMMAKIIASGIYSAAPITANAKCPIITTPNTNTLGADGYRNITSEDIMSLRIALDNIYKKTVGWEWFLPLSSADFYALLKADPVLQAQQGFSGNMGTVGQLRTLNVNGFTIYIDDRAPLYSNANAKLAQSTVANPLTNRKSAVAYVKKKSYGLGFGKMNFFYQEKDPLYQGNLFSTGMQAYAGAPCVNAADYVNFGVITKTN